MFAEILAYTVSIFYSFAENGNGFFGDESRQSEDDNEPRSSSLDLEVFPP